MRRGQSKDDNVRGGLRLAGVALAVAVMAVLAIGCGNEEKGGDGAKCSDSSDCKKGFLCRSDVCVPKGGGMDTGMTDGGGDAGMDTLPDKPQEEDYFVSFELHDEGAGGAAGGKLMVYNTASGELQQVSPDSVSCFSNCWLSADMSKFIYAERNGATFDVYVTDVGSDRTAKAPTGSPTIEGVDGVDVHDGFLAYDKGGQGYYTPLGKNEENTALSVKDDWFFMPETNKVVSFDKGPAAQKLTVTVGDVGSVDSGASVTLGGKNYQESSGSHFGGTYTTSVSRDGNVLAFVAPSQPNDYRSCSRQKPMQPYSSDDCEPSYRCGTQKRCVRKELTVNFIDMQNVNNLGTQCNSPGSCGPIHECSIPSPKRTDEAECIPGRTVLGLPGSVPQTADDKTGCEIIAQDDSIDFTGVNAPLSWDKDGNLYLVGVRERSCLGDYDVPASKIVKINPRDEGYETFAGLDADEKYDPSKCYDPEERALDLENCKVYVDSAHVSPEGNELAYSATNPNTTTPGRARTVTYLWRILRDGTGRTFIGDANTQDPQSVKNIRVHAGN